MVSINLVIIKLKNAYLRDFFDALKTLVQKAFKVVYYLLKKTSYESFVQNLSIYINIIDRIRP